MAQREQHERVKRMDRLADKLLGHKAVVMAILVVIAMASGLAMANLGGGAGSVSFEHTDGSGSLVEPGSGDASSGKTSEGSSPKASAAAEVYVDVDGAVVSPGVYRLKDGARVAQAIDAAGGLAPEADVTGLNRASKVVDGQKIHVPTVGEQQASIAEAGVDGGASASSGVSGVTGLVNINTASAAELQTLSGIGPSMAQSIIDERTKNGGFASVDDLSLIHISEPTRRSLPKSKIPSAYECDRARACDASAASDAVDDGPVCRHVHELRLGAQRGRRCAAVGAGFGGRAAMGHSRYGGGIRCAGSILCAACPLEAVAVCRVRRSRGGSGRLGVVGCGRAKRLEGARRSSGKQP